MEIDVRVESEYTSVILGGSIDAVSSPELEESLKCLIGTRPLILDFRNVDYISSAGLRVMLIIAGEMKHKGGELILFGLNSSVREIFSISGFDTIIRTFENYDDAVNLI